MNALLRFLPGILVLCALPVASAAAAESAGGGGTEQARVRIDSQGVALGEPQAKPETRT